MILNNITRIGIQQKCVRNHVPLILSTTPSMILEKINTHSYQGFSNYAKKVMIENYSNDCVIPNCYVCEN